MRKFSPFETSILGLFFGVIVSTILAFLNSTGAFVGVLLRWVSLLPVAEALSPSLYPNIVYQFLFVVAVYTMYGFVIGVWLQFIILDKTRFAATLAILVFAGMSVEQYAGLSFTPQAEIGNTSAYEASVISATQQPAQPSQQSHTDQQQYFGNEAYGDLNNDGKEDVAFIIPRKMNSME